MGNRAWYFYRRMYKIWSFGVSKPDHVQCLHDLEINMYWYISDMSLSNPAHNFSWNAFASEINPVALPCWTCCLSFWCLVITAFAWLYNFSCLCLMSLSNSTLNVCGEYGDIENRRKLLDYIDQRDFLYISSANAHIGDLSEIV